MCGGGGGGGICADHVIFFFFFLLLKFLCELARLYKFIVQFHFGYRIVTFMKWNYFDKEFLLLSQSGS